LTLHGHVLIAEVIAEADAVLARGDPIALECAVVIAFKA